MVVDTAYYDLLGLRPEATSLEIKKAYRKAAIRLHPDKNPDDPQAAARFQEVGEAYQVLSDDTLRAKYDKFGKQESIPQEGFEDPAEFFSMIFGGEAFKDWIGELSLLQEMSKQAELSEEPETNTTAEIGESATSRTQHKLLEHSSTDTKAARKEELEKYEEECRLKKIEMRKELASKLVDRLSLFTETDMRDDVAASFKEKMRYEAESLKMESFGLEILHTLGNIYRSKSKIFLKNQTFFGWGGFWHSVKEKGGVVKDTIKTVSVALDAQKTMQEYAKMQEDIEYWKKKESETHTEDKPAHTEDKPTHTEDNPSQTQVEDSKGESTTKTEEPPVPEKHTAEELADMEKYLMGKVLAAAWSGSKFEISGTVRGVCDAVLEDPEASLETRIARAKALRLVGDVFAAASRTEAEDEEARVFEELVAEASKKREKRKETESK